MTDAEKPLDPKEAALILKMNSRTIVRWARRGYLPAHPLGEGNRRVWRFFENELLEWVRNLESSSLHQAGRSTLRTAIGAHAKENA